MPPLIRRSQSAVPRHAGEDGGHSVPGSLAGAVASTVFMLAPRCTGRSRSWPFPIGCSRVRPRVVKTLASELGPARRSCSAPPRPASPARCAMIPVDGGAISSI